MSTTQTRETPQASNGFSILLYLRNKWFLLSVAGLALALSAGLSWNWLVAAGIASVLLSVLPCLIMCGLGLCMHKFLGNSGSASAASPAGPSQPEDNRAASYVTSCCGSGSFGRPANAPADGAAEPKEKSNA